MGFWKHKDDPLVCWGESLGDKGFKLFATAHDLPKHDNDAKWAAKATEEGDLYSAVIIERLPKAIVTPKMLPAVLRLDGHYAKHGDPIFEIQNGTEPKIELNAGMKISEVLTFATELGWPFYFSREFLQGSKKGDLRVWLVGSKKDFTPVWVAKGNYRSNFYSSGCNVKEPSVDTVNKRSGCFWTPGEEENLLGMYASENYSIRQMAEYHQRTVSAIESRLKKIGCFKEGPISDEEFLQIQKCAHEKGDMDQLARKLQRAPGMCWWSVYNRM